MKTTTTSILKKAVFLAAFVPALMLAQVDLTIGLNYQYDPPSNCNNQINNLEVDICNNGSSSASSFLVGIYLYLPSTQEHWVLDQTTMNSLSGNACVTISNWNINMNNYPSLPAPGSNYRLGVWADTANVISESNENNNASLLSGNIQVCATPNGIKLFKAEMNELSVFPNPVSTHGEFIFNLVKEEKVLAIISDVTGKPVMEIFNGALLPGQQKIYFNADELSAGIYFATVKSESAVSTKKLIIQK